MWVSYLNLLLFVVCFGGFTWALQGGLFRKTEKAGFGIVLTRVAGLVFMLLHLLALFNNLRVTPTWLAWFGLLFYLAALWLFWQAVVLTRHQPLALAFSQEAPKKLLRGGVYRFIRHPFYTSYILGWLAGVLATSQLWLLVSVVVMTAIYVRAAGQEEALFLHSNWAQDYTNYKSTVGMFFPKIGG
jgi:protein-S-isoprenylcysteine O-methyltransferase Ste14